MPRQGREMTAAVVGRVLSAEGRPLPADVVFLREGGEYRVQSSGDGIFRLRGLSPGAYRLHVQADAHEPFERAVTLTAGEVLTLEVSLAPLPSGAIVEPPEPAPGTAETSSTYRELSRRPDDSGEQSQYSESDAPPAGVDMRPQPDRWSIEMPPWERHPGRSGDFPYVLGRWWDPFNRNRLKGDRPIFGQNTFFNFTGISTTAFDLRRLYVPSGQSSARPGSEPFFGKGRQTFLAQTFRFSFDLFRGDTAFRPFDWRVRLTPAVNVNQIWTRERGIVNPDVRRGTDRTDWHLGLQEAFVEAKLRDLSPNFDFVSVRAGIQQFNSDFRGFVFTNEQPGIRLFGNLRSNRIEYNAAYFFFLEKDTNSGLNTFDSRGQQVFVANVYFQDFLTRGYTTQFSYHFNKDDASVYYDHNNFLVRPAPVGGVQPHDVRAHYLGWAGNGHVGIVNVSHAFYQVLGFDERNPIADRRTAINARFAALELSLDKDWIRPKVAFLFASGDRNPRDGVAKGFDAITEAQTFAGGIFSFFNREPIRLTGTLVGLVAPESFLPNLRSAKDEGQANFVNPGLFLWNVGTDVEITPKLRGFANVNFMRFHHTDSLKLLLFQSHIRSSIGTDYSLGFVYRPPLSENMVLTGGVAALSPGHGLRQVYQSKTLVSAFTVLRLQF